jgi:fermentation-respiration switch protein FrsA (DUF1100 family)
VLLLPGVRANRLSMVDRARFLRAAGYSVLLIDFQATGESPGDAVTFGWREREDVRAAVAYLRAQCAPEPVALIGTSLGGAAALLATPPLQVDALVLEAVYPTLAEATRNRVELRLGRLGRPLAPLLLMQLGPRLGVTAAQLRPIDHVGAVRAPVFVVAGAVDRHTTPAETRRLFAAAPEPKSLWLVDGAAHVDLHRHAGREYERRVLAFLAGALPRGRVP